MTMIGTPANHRITSRIVVPPTKDALNSCETVPDLVRVSVAASKRGRPPRSGAPD